MSNHIYKSDGLTLTKVERESRNGYFYLVHNKATSWTAFRTKAGVKRFLKDYGLTPRLIRRDGKHATFRLTGNYLESSTMDKGMFDSLKADWESWRLSNGDYTKFKILKTFAGHVILSLNPNVRDREVDPDCIHRFE